MYLVTDKETYVLDASEDLAYDVFGNILFHHKTIGYFKDDVILYEGVVLPPDFENYKWKYDGVNWEVVPEPNGKEE